MPQPARERTLDIEDLPPSAKFVRYILNREGTLGRQTLIEETMLAETTVDVALRRLEDAGMVMSMADPYDHRRQLYELVDE